MHEGAIRTLLGMRGRRAKRGCPKTHLRRSGHSAEEFFVPVAHRVHTLRDEKYEIELSLERMRFWRRTAFTVPEFPLQPLVDSACPGQSGPTSWGRRHWSHCSYSKKGRTEMAVDLEKTQIFGGLALTNSSKVLYICAKPRPGHPPGFTKLRFSRGSSPECTPGRSAKAHQTSCSSSPTMLVSACPARLEE